MILVGPRHRCARSGHGEAAARIFRRILDALQFRVGGPEHLKPASADVLKYRRCFDQVAEGGVWIKIKCHGQAPAHHQRDAAIIAKHALGEWYLLARQVPCLGITFETDKIFQESGRRVYGPQVLLQYLV